MHVSSSRTKRFAALAIGVALWLSGGHGVAESQPRRCDCPSLETLNVVLAKGFEGWEVSKGLSRGPMSGVVPVRV